MSMSMSMSMYVNRRYVTLRYVTLRSVRQKADLRPEKKSPTGERTLCCDATRRSDWNDTQDRKTKIGPSMITRQARGGTKARAWNARRSTRLT
jgi:hypothetical protein